MRRVYVLALIWGWSYLLIKKSLVGYTPWSIAFGRMLAGGITLTLIMVFTRRAIPTGRSFWCLSGTLGLVYSAIPFVLQGTAQAHLPTELTAVLNATTPFFTCLIAVFVLGDKFKGYQVIGLCIGFLGVVIAAGLIGTDISSASLFAFALMIGSTICYAVGFNLTKRYGSEIDPVCLVFGQLWTGAGFMLVPAILLGEDKAPTFVSTGALLILGIVGTGFAWILNLGNIKKLGVSNASTVTLLVPIIAGFAGISLLHEPFEWRYVIGGVMTIAGLLVLQGRFNVKRNWVRAIR